MGTIHSILWEIDPYILQTSWFQLRWYSFLLGLSIMLSYLLSLFICKREHQSTQYLLLLIQYVVIGTFIGARFVQVFIYEWAYYSMNPWSIFKIWEGGLASHGGLLGAVIAIYFFARKTQAYSFWWILDRLCLLLPLAGGLIRIGNLFNSEIVGRPTQMKWGFIFPKIDQQVRHPSQLYEAVLLFILFISIWTLYLNKKNLPAGLLTGLLLFVGFSARSFLEIFKAEGQMPQLLSIPVIITGLLLIYWALRR